MAQNTKIQKTQTRGFLTKSQKEMEIFAILCHNFRTNHNLDLLSTS